MVASVGDFCCLSRSLARDETQSIGYAFTQPQTLPLNPLARHGGATACQFRSVPGVLGGQLFLYLIEPDQLAVHSLSDLRTSNDVQAPDPPRTECQEPRWAIS